MTIHHTCTGCHRELPREAFRDISRKIRARYGDYHDPAITAALRGWR